MKNLTLRNHIQSGVKGVEAMNELANNDHENLSERARLVEEQMQIDPTAQTADDRLAAKIAKEMARG